MTKKRKALRTALVSAYLTAMLTSSVTPVRYDVTLATVINPAAALKHAYRLVIAIRQH